MSSDIPLTSIEFIEKYIGDLNLYQYQLDFLRDIERYDKPINIMEIQLKHRQYCKRIEAKLRLTYNLLNNNDVLDMYEGFHYYFRMNDEGELELFIDEYRQMVRGRNSMIMIDDDGCSIPDTVFNEIVDVKKETFTDKLKNALEFINAISDHVGEE